MQSPNKKVNEFLIDIQSTFPDKAEMVEDIRNIFLRENPDLNEEIKYGGITFFASDNLVGGIFIYKQHLSIEFSNGAQFNDSNNFLEGKGKLRRHLKIIEKDDLINKNITAYIKQAVTTKG